MAAGTANDFLAWCVFALICFGLICWLGSDGPVSYSNPQNNHDDQKVAYASGAAARAVANRMEQAGCRRMNHYQNRESGKWHVGRDRYG